MNHRIKRFTVSVLVVVLLTAALSLPAYAQEEDDPVVLGGTAYFPVASLLVAHEKGFFEDEGANIELSMWQLSDYFGAVMAQRVDVFATNAISILNVPASEQGHFVALGSFVSSANANEIVIQAGIDLSDIRMVALTTGSDANRRFEAFAEEHGLDMDTIGSVVLSAEDIRQNLETGRVQAVFGPAQVTQPIVAAGVGEVAAQLPSIIAFGMPNHTLERMTFEEQKAFWRAIITAQEWMSDPDNKTELQETLLAAWGDLAEEMGIADDATFDSLYEQFDFLTGDAMLEANLELAALDALAIKADLGQDTSAFSAGDFVDQTALFEVLAEMGYDVPEDDE